MDNLPEVPVLRVTFDLPLMRYEVPAFRGAVAETYGREWQELHNHEAGKRTSNRHPVVQYGSDAEKAVITGIGPGVEAVKALVQEAAANKLWLRIGERHSCVQIATLEPVFHRVGPLPAPVAYEVRYWLPVRGERMAEWDQVADGANRARFLALRTTAQIRHLLQSLELPEASPEVTVTDYEPAPAPVRYKDRPLVLIRRARLLCPYSLPDGIALGQGAAEGFGVLKRL